jgi:Tfp pilus assembly protein PilP
MTLVVVVAATAAASAQTAAVSKAPAPAQATPKTAGAPAGAPPAESGPTPAEGYTYQADGRRDPFLNLLGTGDSPRTTAPGTKRGEGAAGLTVAEISVRGVLESRGSLIAMIEAPDKKTYVVHSGDKFLDGTIRSITPQGLVIVQEVNDPLSLVKQREIHKLLHSLESAKE